MGAKIHFVTCGQHPDWLDINHPKIALVNHEDYIPKQYLPCYNSNLIEIYMHKIPDLTEHFVYFNDDFFIINHLTQKRFFTDGLPNDIAAFRLNMGLSLWNKCLRNNIRLINKRFNKKKCWPATTTNGLPKHMVIKSGLPVFSNFTISLLPSELLTMPNRILKNF